MELQLNLNLENINILTKQIISKINNLINDSTPLNELLNAKQKTIEQPMDNQRFLSPLRTKISNIENVPN